MWYGCCTVSCMMIHGLHDAIFAVHDVVWVVHDVVHHHATGQRCYIDGARCRAPLCTGSKMPYCWCTMSCTIVQGVHDDIRVVHNIVHHCAPGAQCYMDGAGCHAPSYTRCRMLCEWCTLSCTIVHRLHNAIVVVHNAIWLVHNVVHHRAPGAGYYICAEWYMRGARCRAASCTICTMLHVWCTMSCSILHRVHNAIWVVHPMHDATFVVHYVVHHCAPGDMNDAI